MYDKIDCMDIQNKWLDGRIIDIKRSKEQSSNIEAVDIKVSFTGYSEKFDEWIPWSQINQRVLKQFSGSIQIPPQSYESLQINNRIDVKDLSKNKWREARIVDIQYQYALHQLVHAIKVHYKGLNSKYDEVIFRDQFY